MGPGLGRFLVSEVPLYSWWPVLPTHPESLGKVPKEQWPRRQPQPLPLSNSPNFAGMGADLYARVQDLGDAPIESAASTFAPEL